MIDRMDVRNNAPMTTLFVNRLTTIDLSRLDAERGLVGESWLVDLELEGRLNQQGMILDFSEVKRWVKQTIDRHVDHRLLLPAMNPDLHIESAQDGVTLFFRLASGLTIGHRSPESAIARINSDRIDASTLQSAITAMLQQKMASNISSLRVHLYPEATPHPTFHYSHGLRQHSGNCQRIAHGHRSSIEILMDGRHEHTLAALWAKRWSDTYIGSNADLLQRFERDGIPYYRFGYTGNEGGFELELPEQLCYLIDGDSTIETMAEHIAGSLRQEHPEAGFQVRIYEGVGKGAISKT
jgi:6-pyruvoyl-tetrahydropterin synthase